MKASENGPRAGAISPALMFRPGIAAALLSGLNACSDGCANTPINRVTAPGGRYSASMFERDCGASTGFSTQISLTAQDDMPSGGGNAFIADDSHGAATRGDWGGPWAEMKWIAPDHLLIRYAAKAQVFERDEEVSGVKISYESVNRMRSGQAKQDLLNLNE